MLISFIYKKHPLYNSSFKEKNIIYSCVPIKYKRCSYLLTLFDNLEGILLDSEITVCIYINKKRRIIKTIDNIKDLYKSNIDSCDSFYDTHTSLLFINFQDISIEYIELDSYTISTLLTQQYECENVQISYLNNHLDTITRTGTIIDNYEYDSLDHGFILPPVPHLQCLLHIEDNDNKLQNKEKRTKYGHCDALVSSPITGGSPVYNDGRLCGIIRHASDDASIYKIIPTILIIKSLELNKNVYMFKESTIFSKINYSPNIKIHEETGLYVVENSDITKKLKKGYVITSINGHVITTNDTIMMEEQIIIPINTYIWLLSLEYITISKIKTCNMESILQNYAESEGDSITIHQNDNKRYVNKVKLYNAYESLYKAYEPLFTKFKSGYILEANEHIIKLLKLNNKGESDILLYLWNNRFNNQANKKLYFKRNQVQLLPCSN